MRLSPSRRSALWLGFRARVGAARRRPRSFRPMSAAHGCCFQRRSPHVSAHVASLCSHTMRELAVSRRDAHFGEPTGSRSGCCLPQTPRRRRTSDAPSLAGSPGGAMSAGVGPRSLARSQVETRKPRPTPPSRVKRFSWYRSGPKHLLTPFVSSSGSATRSGRSRDRVLFRTRSHERRTRASAV
jgi:hypothetical protein